MSNTPVARLRCSSLTVFYSILPQGYVNKRLGWHRDAGSITPTVTGWDSVIISGEICYRRQMGSPHVRPNFDLYATSINWKTAQEQQVPMNTEREVQLDAPMLGIISSPWCYVRL